MSFLGMLDWSFLGFYFCVIAGISYWSIRHKKDSPKQYLLANRNLGWFVIGASILASNVGSEHIVGLAGTAAKSRASWNRWHVILSLIEVIVIVSAFIYFSPLGVAR